MTCPSELHNQHAPQVLRLLMAPQATGKTTMAGTVVMIESVLLGVLLVAQREGMSAPHLLDAIYSAVLERLEDAMRQPS